MISFFWRKGFYLNGRIHFYHDFTITYFLNSLFGFSLFFVNLLFIRLEHEWACQTNSNVRGRLALLRTMVLVEQPLEFLYLLNYYLIVTFPILLDQKFQSQLNLLPYYLNRTYRGIAMYINRPLRRRSRARTFASKPNRVFRVKDYWL